MAYVGVVESIPEKRIVEMEIFQISLVFTQSK